MHWYSFEINEGSFCKLISSDSDLVGQLRRTGLFLEDSLKSCIWDNSDVKKRILNAVNLFGGIQLNTCKVWQKRRDEMFSHAGHRPSDLGESGTSWLSRTWSLRRTWGAAWTVTCCTTCWPRWLASSPASPPSSSMSGTSSWPTDSPCGYRRYPWAHANHHGPCHQGFKLAHSGGHCRELGHSDPTVSRMLIVR